jgi:hypothetical protein
MMPEGIRRESGENPEQTRCCKAHFQLLPSPIAAFVGFSALNADFF